MKDLFFNITDDEITIEVTIPLNGKDVLKEMKKVELEMIYKVLRDCGGSRTKAAKRLGIYRTTLVMRLPEKIRKVLFK